MDGLWNMYLKYLPHNIKFIQIRLWLSIIRLTNLYFFLEFLVNYNLNRKGVVLKPRGLINKSNYCYINSILQSLIACPPLIGLFKEMTQHVTMDNKQSTPIIDNM